MVRNHTTQAHVSSLAEGLGILATTGLNVTRASVLRLAGSVDLERMEDPVQRAALEAQIREFGQCPKQIFAGPHPK
eukprot:34817-Eustigmatos_ZCMA.PRE.1